MKNKNSGFIFHSRYLNISYFSGEILIWGQIPFTRYKKYEIQANTSFGSWNLYSVSGAICNKRPDHVVHNFEYSLGPLWAHFEIIDIREWDYHTDKPMLWEEYEKLPEHREGKPKFKYRKIKEKWYFLSKYLKFYNLDFLNDPYGITVDFSAFSLLIYTMIQFGISKFLRFNIAFEANFSQIGPKFVFEICLFSFFIKFELGKNTVVRKANLKRPEDFNNLIKIFANPYLSDDCCNVLQYQIQRKNKKYIENILEKIDVNKFNTDEIIIEAMYNDWYRGEIFDLLLKNINKFDNWQDIEQNCDCYHPEAIEKLNRLKNDK